MEQFLCKYCNKICKNANSLRNHERLCKLNPNHQEITGIIPGWNAGLNKDSNVILKKISEKLKKSFVPYSCKRCGKLVYKKYGSGVFCSKTCACKRKHSEEEKLKIKTTFENIGITRLKEKVCPVCGKVFRKHSITCSIKCGRIYSTKVHPVSNETRKKLSKIIQKRIKEGKHCGWKTRNIESYPETFFKTVLDNNNIKYEFNKPIQKTELGIKENGCYFLDFALSNKIDLEIDGKQHLLKERKIHDIERDNRLTNNGWKVYRIAWKALPRNNKYMKLEIEKFLAWYKENV